MNEPIRFNSPLTFSTRDSFEVYWSDSVLYARNQVINPASAVAALRNQKWFLLDQIMNVRIFSMLNSLPFLS